MDERLRDLRRVVERGPDGRRGFPASVRRRAAAWARKQRAAGEPMLAVASRLGVSHETLRRWMKDGVSTFRRVNVATPSTPTAPRGGGVTVRLPSGLAVEGLSVEELVVVIRALS